MVQELTSRQVALARYMSELSEEAYCAEWMDRLEFDLWNAVASGPGRYGAIELASAHIEKLSQLSHACGGWIAFDEKRDEVFVPMDQWLSRFAMIAALDTFTPADKEENPGRLYDIFSGFDLLPPESRAPFLPAMFGLIERFPEAEFGTPGPLVHAIESIPGYESLLQVSILRQPATLNVWMVNRILNSTISPEMRANWLQVLRVVLAHPSASTKSREMAGDFLCSAQGSLGQALRRLWRAVSKPDGSVRTTTTKS